MAWKLVIHPNSISVFTQRCNLFVDESHVTVPQIGAMHNGNQACKEKLINYGFRLPSSFDNRHLKFEAWEKLKPQTIYISASPGKYKLEKTNSVFIEQVIHPTGLLDQVWIVKPIVNQVDDVIHKSRSNKARAF